MTSDGAMPIYLPKARFVLFVLYPWSSFVFHILLCYTYCFLFYFPLLCVYVFTYFGVFCLFFSLFFVSVLNIGIYYLYEVKRYRILLPGVAKDVWISMRRRKVILFIFFSIIDPKDLYVLFLRAPESVLRFGICI